MSAFINLRGRLGACCFALFGFCAASAPQAAYAGAAAACRKAVWGAEGAKPASANGAEGAGQPLRELLTRSYEPLHKKKRDRKNFQSRLNSLAEKGLSAKEILSRLMAEGLIAPESPGPLFGMLLNQPPEMAARLAESSPEAVREGSLLGSPPFFIAVLTGEREAAAAFLKAAPDIIHSENSQGESPLHYALDPEMAAFLLGRGADPDRRDKKGFAPLHYARGAGLAKALLSHGADWRLKDRSGQPLIRYHETAVRDPEIIRLLREAQEESRRRHLRAGAPPPPDPAELRRQAEKEEEARLAREAKARSEAERAAAERLLRQREKRKRKEAGRARKEERERERQALAAADRQTAARERAKVTQEIKDLNLFETQNYAFFGPFLEQAKQNMLKNGRQKLKKLGGGAEDFLPSGNEKPAGAASPNSAKAKEGAQNGEKPPLMPEEEVRALIKKAGANLKKDARKRASHVAAKIKNASEGQMARGVKLFLDSQEEIHQDLSRLRLDAESNPIIILFLHTLREEFSYIKQLQADRRQSGAAKFFEAMEDSVEGSIKAAEDAIVDSYLRRDRIWIYPGESAD